MPVATRKMRVVADTTSRTSGVSVGGNSLRAPSRIAAFSPSFVSSASPSGGRIERKPARRTGICAARFRNADDWDLPEGATPETDEGQATVAPSDDYPPSEGVLLTVATCSVMCRQSQISG